MYERYDGLPDVTLSEQKRKTQSKGAGASARGASSARAGAYDAYLGDIYPRRSGSSARGGSSGSRSGGSGSRGSRRKKARRRQALVLCFTLLIIALLVVAVVVIFRSCSGDAPVEPVDPVTGVFREGVTINGIPVADMTMEAARAAVQPGLDYTIANIAITLKNDAINAMITGEDMSATTDLDTLLATALSGGANQAYYTVIKFDYNALDARIMEINESLSSGPTEPTMSIQLKDSGKPEFVYAEGKPGTGLDIPATEEQVRAALESNQLQAVLEPILSYQQPTLTVADLQARVTLRASFTTTYRFKGTSDYTDEEKVVLENRAFNIEKGADKINNYELKPGATFSFNKIVGDRDEQGGWKEANGISFGDRFTLQYGGGICQVSTTLYNAVKRANLEVTSRRQHSIPSDYVDKGLDATVDTDHIDFKFKNNTESPIYIFAYVTTNKSSSRKRDLTVAIYGEALPEGTTYRLRSEIVEEILPGEMVIVEDKKQMFDFEQIIADQRTGYVVDVYFETYQDGKLIDSEKIYTDTYEAKAGKKKVGILTPSPSPSPNPTPAPSGTEDLP